MTPPYQVSSIRPRHLKDRTAKNIHSKFGPKGTFCTAICGVRVAPLASLATLLIIEKNPLKLGHRVYDSPTRAPSFII